MGQFRSNKQNKKRIIIRITIFFLACVIPLCFLIKFYHKSHSHSSTFKEIHLTLPEKEPVKNIVNEIKKTESETEPETEKLQVMTFSKGASLASVFQKLKVSNQTLQKILKDNPYASTLTKIKAGQKIEFLITDNVLEKLILPLNVKETLVIRRINEKYESIIEKKKLTTQNCYITATVQKSIHNTAKKLNIPYKLINKMSEIFTWEIDFSKDVRTGDQFTIMYKGYFIEDKLVETGEIVAITYKNRNKTLQAIAKFNPKGNTEYFTPEGLSLTKAFNRYPIKFSHISSPFSLARKHPTLNVIRPHKGVDLAAPIGTPIKATGDGKIKLLGNQSGYGNMIKIEHNKNHSSIYAHMLKFEKGLSVGKYVKRGQIIGYVGQSGVATGPHCHYEFHINKQPKNPTTVELPRASPVPKVELAQFKTNALTLLANINLFEQAKYANLENKNQSQG